MRTQSFLAPLAVALLLPLGSGHHGGAMAAQQAGPAPDSTIRAIIADRVAKGLTTGIVVGVLEPDGRRRIVAAGASGTARPLDERTVFEYSNVGVGLLGHALSRRAGTDLETLYRQRLLDPLGMRDTRIVLAPALRERLAIGHDPAGDVVPNWDLDVLAGAGALRSTASDMLTWIGANLAADADSVRGTLAPALHTTHAVRRTAGSAQMGIGLAWHVLTTPEGGHVVWHNGGTGGYRTFSGYDPVRRWGVVILTNSATSADDIGFHLLAPSLPLRPPVVPPMVRRVAIALPAAVLDRYVGEYELAPTFHILVTREGDGLVIAPTGQGKVAIFAEKETEFFLTVVDAQLTFELGAGGTVTALVLHQNGRDVRGAKIR